MALYNRWRWRAAAATAAAEMAAQPRTKYPQNFQISGYNYHNAILQTDIQVPTAIYILHLKRNVPYFKPHNLISYILHPLISYILHPQISHILCTNLPPPTLFSHLPPPTFFYPQSPTSHIFLPPISHLPLPVSPPSERCLSIVTCICSSPDFPFIL